LRKKFLFPLSVLFVALLASLSYAAHVHWSYEGEEGPANWGKLSPEFGEAIGSAQSPVDIPLAEEPRQVSFHYNDGNFSALNNGHTIQLSPDEKNNSYIMLEGKKYFLQQLHFHAPSEHTIGGKAMPMEVHFVHRASDDKLAVVGLFVDEGAENTAIGDAWASAPKNADEAPNAISGTFALTSLLPKNHDGLRYEGSLTTPPTNEGVSWMLFNEHGAASPEQISWFTGVIGKNARPTQPLNGRRLSPIQGQ
jgi:carbonic anhydrase